MKSSPELTSKLNKATQLLEAYRTIYQLKKESGLEISKDQISLQKDYENVLELCQWILDIHESFAADTLKV